MPGVFRRPPRLPPSAQSPALGFLTAKGIITGTAALSEAADTLSSAATLLIKGTVAVTEGADTLVATGIRPAITGSASLAEAADTISAAGGLALKGTASVTEGADTLVATGIGAVAITGTANLVEGADTVTAEGSLQAQAYGEADLNEGHDTLVATGQGQVLPPQPLPPRGAWISDQRVERERERKWSRQKRAERDLRQALDELLTGRPSDATLALRAAQNEVELALLEAASIDQELLQLRAEIMAMQQGMEIAKLRRMIAQVAAMEAEAQMQEEAGIVALLLAT